MQSWRYYKMSRRARPRSDTRKLVCPNCQQVFHGNMRTIPVHNCMVIAAHEMRPQLWVLQIWRGVEPILHGPYATEETRGRAVRRKRKDDRDSFFYLDCLGKPIIDRGFETT